jgi:RimJ/RimL family protein N-acetyltransferase
LKHINETIENRFQNTKYSYGIEVDGEVVGDVSLRNLNDDSHSPEIGYWMSPDYAGKGVTTRAVEALTRLGIETLGLREVIIRANPDNIASNKVAEKNGYQLVGTEVEDGELLNVWKLSKQS